VLAVLLTGWARAAAAQETPRHGGDLVFVVPLEPPFTFRNRAIRDPYESLGVWLVDQRR
jgi:hypothetical protein